MWAKPVVSPDDHPDPGPPLATRRELLDPTIVEHRPGRLAVLGEDLRHLAAPGQRGPEDAFEDGGLDERAVDIGADGHERYRNRHAQRFLRGRRRRPTQGWRPDCAARVSLTVTDADTARALRSGDVPVLGTPRLVALCEEASCRALDGHLGPGRTSVASRIQFDHLAPVAVGATVVAEATLERVEGRRLSFTISVSRRTNDESALVGAGRLLRVLVDREKFLAKATGPVSG